MIDYQTVGMYISELRKACGLTQTELAERINVTHQAVSKWENGMTLPDTEILFALSKMFRVSIDDILNANRKKSHINSDQENKNVHIFSKELTKRINEGFGINDDNSEENESPLGYLCGLAPFLSREVIDKEIENIVQIELGNLIGLAPFLSREALDKAVDRITDNQIDLGLVIGIAPFVSRDKLDVLTEKVTEYDIGNIVGIAPFLHSCTIEKLLRKNGLKNIERGLLQGLAPFISRELLNELYVSTD